MGGCTYSRIKRRSDIMEFLIVLKENDFKSHTICPSYYDQIIKYEDEFPGILHCIDLADLNKICEESHEPAYVVRDMTMPRITYIKLPKENIYVKSEDWEFEYMKSQIQEIILIFGILGAKKITYDVSDNDEDNKNIGANIGIGEPNLTLAAGIDINEKKSNYSKFSGEVEYPHPIQEAPTLERLEKEKNIYYLPRKFHWQRMVRTRIESYITKDVFDYKFGRDINISTSLSAKFSKLGIGFNIGNNNLSDFRMKFDIEYYPVSKDQIYKVRHMI